MILKPAARCVCAVTATVLLAACGGNAAAPVREGKLDIVIKAKDKLRFEPNVIDAKVGQTVLVMIENVSRSDHSFTIDELQVQSGAIAEGEQGVVSFVADKAGRYTFYSAQPGERTGGMVGTLNVTD